MFLFSIDLEIVVINCDLFRLKKVKVFSHLQGTWPLNRPKLWSSRLQFRKTLGLGDLNFFGPHGCSRCLWWAYLLLEVYVLREAVSRLSTLSSKLYRDLTWVLHWKFFWLEDWHQSEYLCSSFFLFCNTDLSVLHIIHLFLMPLVIPKFKYWFYSYKERVVSKRLGKICLL